MEEPTSEPPRAAHLGAQLAFAALAAVVVYGFVDMAKHAEARRSCDALVQLRPRYLGAERLAPDFDLADGFGGRVKLSSFRGKTVLLHFWTKTCQPCLEELPFVAQFAAVVRDRRDIAIVTVTIDKGPDDVKDVLATVFEGKPPPFVVAYDPESSVVLGKYGTKLFPETWLIDPQGIIRARFDGIPMAGESCEVAWKNPLLVSAIDSLKSPAICDLTFDPKVDPGRVIAECRR